MLDLGEYWDVHQKELNVLDDEFYVAPPAQVRGYMLIGRSFLRFLVRRFFLHSFSRFYCYQITLVGWSIVVTKIVMCCDHKKNNLGSEHREIYYCTILFFAGI